MKRYLYVLAAALWTQIASAKATVADVEACVTRNLPETSGELEFTLQAEDREGGVRESAAQLLWRRGEDEESRALLRISEPPEMRGTSVLMVQHPSRDTEVFVYLPELEKVRRIRKGQLKGSFLGTDFSYEDFERLRGRSLRTRIEIKGSALVGGREAWALEGSPDPRERSAYGQVVTYVDKLSCLPIRMEFRDARGRLRKLLTTEVSAIRQEGERFVPASYRMRDLRRGTETRVIVDRFRIDPGLAEQQLSREALPAAPR